MQGEACLLVPIGARKAQSISIDVGDRRPTPQHALALWLRGPGIDTKASLKLELRTASGAAFERDVNIVNFEWDEWVFFPAQFRTRPSRDGKPPRWEDIRTIAFHFRRPEAGQTETVQIDSIRFEPLGTPRSLAAVRDKRFWWWRGPIDRFASMHLRFAHWPRIAELGEQEMASFSRYVLAPGMPYTLYLRNPGGKYGRFRATVRDWDGNAIRVLEVSTKHPEPGRYLGRAMATLRAPQRCGTYVIEVEAFDTAGKPAATYQTGVFVLAKILSEPEGYWGLHGFIGGKSDKAPHLRWVIRTLDAFGVKIIRDRIGFPAAGVAGETYTHREREVAEMAHERNIRFVGVLSTANRKAYHLGRGAKPGIIKDAAVVEEDARKLAEDFRGLVDIWEVYNEPNRGKIEYYAENLRVTYKGLRRGDPDVQISMAGMGVWNKWQTKLIDLEKKTGQPYSDMLATHLYPVPAQLESILREMIHSERKHLREKGMLMTEAGTLEINYKIGALLKAGLLAPDYHAERVCQFWFARYAPIILGELQKMGARLHGCAFFRCTPSMGDWFLRDGDLVHATGFFTNRWNTRTITLARPAAYALNTTARLLTHEVRPTRVSISYDRKAGAVERYAFRRPGETILAMWVGLKDGTRAEALEIRVRVPKGAALVLAADMDGNERIVEPADGSATVRLRRDRMCYVRMLQGRRAEGVFLQNLDRLAGAGGRRRYRLVTSRRPTPQRKAIYARLAAAGISRGHFPLAEGVNVYVGTPADTPRLIDGISRDRNLPVVTEMLPQPGRPMVLYSPVRRELYLVGQSDEDLKRAVDVCLREIRPKAE